MLTYDVMIAYDVSGTEARDFIKGSMIGKGYADRLTYPGTARNIFYLPDTNLWKPSITIQEALNDLVGCMEEYNRDKREEEKRFLERSIAFEFTGIWNMVSRNLPHTGHSDAPEKK